MSHFNQTIIYGKGVYDQKDFLPHWITFSFDAQRVEVLQGNNVTVLVLHVIQLYYRPFFSNIQSAVIGKQFLFVEPQTDS